MGTVLTILFYTALLLVFSLPVVIVAWRQGRKLTVRKFLMAAVACGVLCGLLVAGSDQLVAECKAEGNTRCFDSGLTGMVVLIVGGFLITSAVKAYFFVTD